MFHLLFVAYKITQSVQEGLTYLQLKLKINKGQDDYVFTRKDGQKIKSIKEAFTIACKRADIKDFRFHDLRHTAASLLAAGGCDIITLQNILGHKTLALTQRYAHLIPDRNERAKEIMQRFWQGDTKSDTVSKDEKYSSLSH